MSEMEFRVTSQEWQAFQEEVQKVEAAETKNFIELAKLLGLNPKTDFVGADLRNTDLSNLDLRDVDLSYADLQFANLSYTNLSNANLSNTNLSNANLNNTNFKFSNLDGTIGIESLSDSFRRECLRRWLEGEVNSQWQTEEQLPINFRTKSLGFLRSPNIDNDRSYCTRVIRYRIVYLSDFSITLKANLSEDKVGNLILNIHIYPTNGLGTLPAGLRVSVIDENGVPDPEQNEELTQPESWYNLLILELEPGEEFGIQLRAEDSIFVENFIV